MTVGPTIKVRCPATSKVCYGLLGRALEAAARVETGTGHPYRTYLCQHCGCWHLTSQPWRPHDGRNA